MDTDDLELDGDDLLPPFRGSFHQQSYEGPRARPARTPVSRNHAEAPINADAAKSILSIPGPAGAPGSSEAMHQGISMEGSHTGVSDALGTIGPHSTVVSSFLVILEECLPHIDGGGCAVKLKDSAGTLRGCMTAQCFKSHPQLECGMYMQLSDVAVLHVSEGQSYACIVPQNIVNTYATRPQSTELIVMAQQPVHNHENIRPIQATTQGTTSIAHDGRPAGLEEAARLPNYQHQGHAETCARSHESGTLRDRIVQLQRSSQTSAHVDPLGQSASQSQGLTPVGAQSTLLTRSHVTPACSQQQGCSPQLSSAAPSSVSTQPYSNALSQQNSVKASAQMAGGRTAHNPSIAQPTTRPRRAWVQQLKAELATNIRPGAQGSVTKQQRADPQQSAEQQIGQSRVHSQQAKPVQAPVQPQQPASASGGKTATLLSRLRGQSSHQSTSMISTALPAGQAVSSMVAKSQHPLLAATNPPHAQREPSAFVQRQQTSNGRKPLAPLNLQQPWLSHSGVESQRASLSQQHSQFRNLSRNQQLALDSAGLGHSQSSAEL